MDKFFRSTFKFVIKLMATPFVLVAMVAILIVYTLFSIVIIPAQSIRFFGLTILLAIKSAFKNWDYTNIFLDKWYELLKKHILFYGEIIHVLSALWYPANQNPSNLDSLVKYQWKLLSSSWVSTIVVFGSLILSIGFSMAYIALNSIDYFDNINRRAVSSVEYVAEGDSSEQIDEGRTAMTFHPFGKGNGRIAFFSDCSMTHGITIYLDGRELHEDVEYLSGFLVTNDTCYSSSYVLKENVKAGRHTIKAIDLQAGFEWDEFVVYIKEDECLKQNFPCEK